jgi:hypothetical protein
MRIYIKQYNLNTLQKKIKQFDKYIQKTSDFIEIYSEEGIYHIDANNIYKLAIIDKPIQQYTNYYNDLSLIVDYSFSNKIKDSQVPANGIDICVKNIKYSLQTDSKISMILQVDNLTNRDESNVIDLYFEINNKECEEIDLNNYFIKNELNVFLSLLN